MNEHVKKLYNNCLSNMRNTAGDWEKAAGAFMKLYPRLDRSGKADCLAAYDRLAKEIESGN